MKYDKVFYYRDYWRQGVLIVIKDGMYGTTDRNGNEIIPCQYESAQMLFSSGKSVSVDSLSYYKSFISRRLKDFMED